MGGSEKGSMGAIGSGGAGILTLASSVLGLGGCQWGKGRVTRLGDRCVWLKSYTPIEMVVLKQLVTRV